MTLSGDDDRRTLEMPRSLGIRFNPVRFHFRMDATVWSRWPRR
jgi:DUF1365 family protein